MSSLTEHERIGLDDVFLCLGEKQSLSEKLKEQNSRLFSGLAQVAKKGLPLGLRYVKSKKIMFHRQAKMEKYKLLKHFRPKNRGSK